MKISIKEIGFFLGQIPLLSLEAQVLEAKPICFRKIKIKHKPRQLRLQVAILGVHHAREDPSAVGCDRHVDILPFAEHDFQRNSAQRFSNVATLIARESYSSVVRVVFEPIRICAKHRKKVIIEPER